MGVQIDRTELPGIGIRYDVMTNNGRRIGVVAHRDGGRELGIFEEDDPDACRSLVQLSREEATALSEVLGAALLVGQVSPSPDQAVDLQTEHFVLPAQSLFTGKTLGDTKARTRTGVSIVAISHNGTVIPAPTPEALLSAGDTLVAVGTRTGLDALGRLLAQSD